MKKYIIILMSMLIAPMIQLDASWKKSATTRAAAASAMLAAHYDRNEMAPVMSPVNASTFNQVPSKKLTDSDFYKPTMDEFKKIGMNFPAFSLPNNYESMQNDESIEGLEFNELKSTDTWPIESKAAKELADSIARSNALVQSYDSWFNSLDLSSKKLMDNLLDNLSRDQCILFVEKLNDMSENFHKNIGVENVVDAYLAVGLLQDVDENIKKSTKERILRASRKILKKEMNNAIHESGHALMTVLLPELHQVNYATIIPSTNTFGHVNVDPKIISYLYRLDYYKNQIMIELSSGIAMLIKDKMKLYTESEKRLDFSDFLLIAKDLGMGDRYSQGTDIYQMYENAGNYLSIAESYDSCISRLTAKLTFNEDEQRKHQNLINRSGFALLEQCYNEAYDIISAHEDRLDLMSDELFKHKILPGSRLEEFVDSSKY